MCWCWCGVCMYNVCVCTRMYAHVFAECVCRVCVCVCVSDSVPWSRMYRSLAKEPSVMHLRGSLYIYNVLLSV